jgi:hypothetical protein
MDMTHPIDYQPTDMMHRRTSLPFFESFRFLGVPVTVRTNTPAILTAAKNAGLIQQQGQQLEHAMQWDIVGENGAEMIGDWQCEISLDAQSLYLSMGPYQWFAFDLETGEGSGFIIVPDLSSAAGLNTRSFVRAVVDNVGPHLREEFTKSYLRG